MSEHSNATMQGDLRSILIELGLSDHARPISPHQVVIREVLPRIREVMAAWPEHGPHAHEWNRGRCLVAGCGAIDPADVKVGDVVEVEADDGSWLVRGEVLGLGGEGLVIFHVRLSGTKAAVPYGVATVRLVRRAEPEPDPEHIKALEAVLDDAGCGDEDNHSLARELVRRGVTVRKDGAA